MLRPAGPRQQQLSREARGQEGSGSGHGLSRGVVVGNRARAKQGAGRGSWHPAPPPTADTTRLDGWEPPAPMLRAEALGPLPHPRVCSWDTAAWSPAPRAPSQSQPAALGALGGPIANRIRAGPGGSRGLPQRKAASWSTDSSQPINKENWEGPAPPPGSGWRSQRGTKHTQGCPAKQSRGRCLSLRGNRRGGGTPYQGSRV